MVGRKIIFWLWGILVVVGLAVGLFIGEKRKQRFARAAWKTTALKSLASQSITNESLAAELDQLKTGISVGNHAWVGEHVLLMTNGDYLIYTSRHGANNGFVDHLFLARGSGNRWLYSTYHFCNSMVMLLSDQPPGSIREFAERYAAKEFDGSSDECLNHTWPEKK